MTLSLLLSPRMGSEMSLPTCSIHVLLNVRPAVLLVPASSWLLMDRWKSSWSALWVCPVRRRRFRWWEAQWLAWPLQPAKEICDLLLGCMYSCLFFLADCRTGVAWDFNTTGCSNDCFRFVSDCLLMGCGNACIRLAADFSNHEIFPVHSSWRRLHWVRCGIFFPVSQDAFTSQDVATTALSCFLSAYALELLDGLDAVRF